MVNVCQHCRSCCRFSVEYMLILCHTENVKTYMFSTSITLHLDLPDNSNLPFFFCQRTAFSEDDAATNLSPRVDGSHFDVQY